MNYFHDESTAEYNRQRALSEIKQIRLEKIALQARVHHPTQLDRTMFRFANWMIATGKKLRQHYEIPVTGCGTTISSSHPAR